MQHRFPISDGLNLNCQNLERERLILYSKYLVFHILLLVTESETGTAIFCLRQCFKTLLLLLFVCLLIQLLPCVASIFALVARTFNVFVCTFSLRIYERKLIIAGHYIHSKLKRACAVRCAAVLCDVCAC